MGNNLSEVDVFKLIDEFYRKNKSNSLETILTNVSKRQDERNVYTFNFINFIEYYKIHLRGLINREQEDDKEIFTKIKMRQFKTYGRNGFYLSNKLLNIYMNISNNNFESFSKLFKLIKCENDLDKNINMII